MCKSKRIINDVRDGVVLQLVKTSKLKRAVERHWNQKLIHYQPSAYRTVLLQIHFRGEYYCPKPQLGWLRCPAACIWRLDKTSKPIFQHIRHWSTPTTYSGCWYRGRCCNFLYRLHYHYAPVTIIWFHQVCPHWYRYRGAIDMYCFHLKQNTGD